MFMLVSKGIFYPHSSVNKVTKHQVKKKVAVLASKELHYFKSESDRRKTKKLNKIRK